MVVEGGPLTAGKVLVFGPQNEMAVPVFCVFFSLAYLHIGR